MANARSPVFEGLRWRPNPVGKIVRLLWEKSAPTNLPQFLHRSWDSHIVGGAFGEILPFQYDLIVATRETPHPNLTFRWKRRRHDIPYSGGERQFRAVVRSSVADKP